MAIARFTYRNPWQELDQLTRGLTHFLDVPAANGGWTPAVNVEEREDELLLTAEVPGMSAESIEIEVENNLLTIRGEKAEERQEGDGSKYHVRERRQGSFRRSFTLPRTVRADQISADHRDGVLTIRMPKAPEAKSRKIEIGAPAAAQLGGKTS